MLVPVAAVNSKILASLPQSRLGAAPTLVRPVDPELPRRWWVVAAPPILVPSRLTVDVHDLSRGRLEETKLDVRLASFVYAPTLWEGRWGWELAASHRWRSHCSASAWR